jgi:hemerythrin-like domain-containing protein
MAIQIGEAPSPTFAEPLALLSDCHRRVKRFLAVLLTVAEDAAGTPLRHEQREAFATALLYFREAAPKHTADEEESLFPRMRAQNSAAAHAALAQLAALEADHQLAGPLHDLIERLGQAWLRQGSLAPAEATVLTDSLRTLRDLYEHHIDVEDHQIFPLAGRVLGAAELAEVGREMAGRRGLTFVADGRPNLFRQLIPASHAAA